jgi:two-component system sensor histidine kinase BaeS
VQQSAAAFPEVLAADRGDGVARGGDIAPWALALVLAGLGTGTDFDAQPGVNWGIWTTIAAVGLLWVGRRRARAQAGDAQATGRVDPVAVWAAGLAILVAWGAAVTENDLFQFLIVVTCATLLAVATRVLAGMPGREVGIGVVAGAPFSAGSTATVEAGRRAVAAIARARDGRRTALVRGILLALPVAAGFALVLAGADPILTVLRDRLWDALTQAISIAKVMFFLGLGTLALGAYGLATRARGERSTRPVADTRVVFGATERRVIVGAVVGVFGAFLALQATYLFLDVGALRVSGVTYAEYAHQGFVELTIAATLAIGLVVGLDHWGSPERDARESARWRHWGTLLLIAEVLIVLASAFHRLTLYESAYGYTMLRLYVQAYELGVAITLVMLAVEVARPGGAFDARRAARRSGVVAVGFLAAFSFTNPEAWVVRQDVARFYATGKLDTPYLAGLSLNAVPALVEVASTLPPVCAGYVRQDLGAAHRELARHPESERWYEWNLRRARGLAALRAAAVRPPSVREMGGCYPGERPASD